MTDNARELYTVMVLCRAFEDALIENAARDSVRIGHPYRGQEAVAAGICGALKRSDRVTSTHRSHGHAVAKGCDLRKLYLELYGSSEGMCRGRGGEMHVTDYSVGFMGATDIVGGNLAMATGLALAAQLEGSDRVTAAFVGDGGSNQGVLYEAMNLASIWRLPLIVVCEDNGYAESTPSKYSIGGPGLQARASAFGLASASVDGQDVFAVCDVARQAVERARAGLGASFIEAKTYRFYGHYYGDRDSRYRTSLEVARWRGRDPIAIARAALIEVGILDVDAASEIETEARERVLVALAVAQAGRDPEPEDLLDGVFAAIAGDTDV